MSLNTIDRIESVDEFDLDIHISAQPEAAPHASYSNWYTCQTWCGSDPASYNSWYPDRCC